MKFEMPYYTSATESYEKHAGCRMNLAGSHAGNRYCLDHKVLVKRPGDL